MSQQEKEKYYPIPISTTIPNWYSDYEEHHTFISPYNILPRYKSGKITWEEYTIEYIELLDELEKMDSIYEFYSKIEEETNREVVLLCYESNNKPCHRHILADYLNKKYNVNIKEL